MKNIIKNITLCGCVALGLGMVSCEDMMTVDTGDKAYTSANDTLYSYLGIMRAMQDVAERQVILGEIRGDLVSSTEYTTDTLYAISNFDNPKDQSCSMLQVSDYYNVINNCNFYINNCDTNTVKSNIKYMIPEYTQVKAIRAWAYLQLVKNYKEVPYITEPVKNLDIVKNFDYKNNVVNKDNLIDKFIEDGLVAAVDVNYPQYGTTTEKWGKWNNGNVDISARLCYVPIRLVLGDAYLLRGQDTGDYENAAKYYYEFLKHEKTPMVVDYCEPVVQQDKVVRSRINGSWGEWAGQYSYDEEKSEVITTIPGSANAGLGKLLTRVADIYGFQPSSSQSTMSETKKDDDGNESTEYSAAGAININPTYKRQYAPSYAFADLNNEQTFVEYKGLSSASAINTVTYVENCDARYLGCISSVTYESDKYQLCSKAAKITYYYCIPVYRKTLIWLRLAEAINRAGYPEFAFAILKDGINDYTIPSVVDRVDYKRLVKEVDGTPYYYRVNAEGLIIYEDTANTSKRYAFDEDGNFVSYSGKIIGYSPVQDTLRSRVMDYGSFGAMYYIPLEDSLRIEKFNNFLNFKDEVWDYTYGIHARGCGFDSWSQDNYTTNISGYLDSVYYDYSKLLLAKGVTLGKASQEEIINGVENIIVDELALETAFEGNRFTDLVRIAEHKNASGFDGTDWLAKKIANRNVVKKISATTVSGEFDSSLYNKLKSNPKLWYFELPTVK